MGTRLRDGGVGAVVQRAFTNDDVYRVWTYVGVDNVASQRVLERVGMTNEGVLHRWLPTPNLAAEPSDAYVFAVWR
jgi:RimJ/RimL family protein N-acetyltransferase